MRFGLPSAPDRLSARAETAGGGGGGEFCRTQFQNDTVGY